jgi:lycopene cyclase domain-containing protein
MTGYTIYNVVLATLILPPIVWYAAREARWRDLRISIRVSFLMAVIAYPWDFFAIHHNVWAYPNDPGPRLYDVPLNDLVFIWICTQLASSVLLAVIGREARH